MSDTESLDNIIRALYESICGAAGVERQWDRLRALFMPEARLMRTSVGPDGKPQALTMDVETYIRTASDYFRRQGFYEVEVARHVDSFGNIAQVFSTYEARNNLDEVTPLKRGINSIQLYYDGGRWWVVNMLWDDEREGNSLPEEYSP